MNNPMHPAGSARRAAQLLPRFAAGLIMAAALIFAAGSPAVAASETSAVEAVEAAAASGKPFTICDDQTYALCAAAKCTVLNGLSYCKCDVKKGDSISLTQDYKKGDVCTFNARGKGNGYMVSTFSLPPSVVKPGGDQAVYDCAADTSTGAYAQCDGGVCFQSSRGQQFPGFPEKLADNEIICACPAVVADPDTAKIGFQIIGPYPCRNNFFKYCNSPTATTDNGSTQYVGAPTGSARFLTRKLYGSAPSFNHCRAPTN